MGLKQYSIVLVNLDPTVGSEIRKTRPCLVISPDEMNRGLRTLVVAPMTTTRKAYPTRIDITLDNKRGQVALDQIRTIDRKRVVRVLGNAKPKEINQVKRCIREAYVD